MNCFHGSVLIKGITAKFSACKDFYVRSRCKEEKFAPRNHSKKKVRECRVVVKKKKKKKKKKKFTPKKNKKKKKKEMKKSRKKKKKKKKSHTDA